MTTLVMGPVLFNWPVEEWRDFHFRIADEADVDTVCVGEVVCSKRSPLFAPYLPEIVQRLQNAGKQVVLSTLALIMDKREMESVREIAAMDEPDILIEANDISVIALLAGRPHAAGPYLNVYNEDTLAFLARNGARSVCLPVELDRTALAVLAKNSPVELEVLVFGRMPLAISARCYHARAHGLHKDNCNYVCAEDRDGMAVETLDGDAFVAINGVQTLSHAYAELGASVPALIGSGIRRLRLSPHAGMDMTKVADIYRAVADGALEPAEAGPRLAALAGDVAFCNGYINGDIGCLHA